MGCAERVSTMVLSEALGLWLFSVIRGGIELTLRLRAWSTFFRLPEGWILALEPSGFENRLSQRQGNLPWHRFTHHTLKLLAVSVLVDRSVLLSSKLLKRSPPSSEPRSDAPSTASSL